MLLKLSYCYRGEPMEVEHMAVNYTFGFPMLYFKFKEKHGASLEELQKQGLVTEAKTFVYKNDRWITVEFAGFRFR